MPGRDQDSIKQKRQEKREKVAFGESARQRVKQKERKIQKDDDSSICSRQRACFICCFHALTDTSCHLPSPFTHGGHVNRLATLLLMLLMTRGRGACAKRGATRGQSVFDVDVVVMVCAWVCAWMCVVVWGVFVCVFSADFLRSGQQQAQLTRDVSTFFSFSQRPQLLVYHGPVHVKSLGNIEAYPYRHRGHTQCRACLRDERMHHECA